jgi:hypothetical protein
MRARYWVLDAERHPVAVDTLEEWAEFWANEATRRVGWDEFDPGIQVSTVFLGIDHRYHGEGPPILFETMVFGLSVEDDDFQLRYSTWDDAETGHKVVVRKVKELIARAAKVTTKAKEEC